MSAAIRSHDWTGSPLGSPETWPAPLRVNLATALAAVIPSFIVWGPERTLLYNDAYAPILATRHPAAFGQPFREVWPEIWPELEPLVEKAFAGEATTLENIPLRMERHGYVEDTWFTYFYTPIRFEDGTVGGFYGGCIETTSAMLAGQRRDLAEMALRRQNTELEQNIEDRTRERDRIWQVSRDMLLVADTAGVWLNVNPAWTACLGWSEDELTGKTSTWIEHPDEHERNRAELGKVATGQTAFAFENRMRTRAGDYRHLSWTAVLADDKVYAVARDVTVEQRQRAVLASAIDVAIVMTDREGLVTDWNTGAERVFGWRAAEMRGQPAERFYTPEDQAGGQVALEMRLALRDGRANDERWHLKKDGSRFWASGELMPLRDEAGVHLGFTKIVRDRTTEHEAGVALEETQERYRLASKATNDAIWDWDLTTNHVLWNEALEDAYGHSPAMVEPTGDWWIAHIHPDDRARIDASIHAVIDGTGTAWTDEYRFLRADGSYADVLDRGQVIRSAEGAPVRMIGAMLDLTRIRNAEAALLENESRFRTILDTIEAAFAVVQVKFDVDDRPVDYRFVEANPAFERQAGVNLRGKWVTEFAPDLERFWFETYGHVARTGEPASFENYAEAFQRWFDVRAVRIGNPAERQIAIFFDDSTARRQLQTRNNATQELSDRLQDLTEPSNIAAVAAEILGKTLKASLVGYGRVDAEAETITVERDWSVEGIDGLPRLIRSRDYGDHFDNLTRGETVAIADVALDPRTTAFTAKLDTIGARAFVNIPLFEHGRLVALLYVGQSKVRHWTDDEVTFLRDVAERVRAATERAQGEKDLRVSEARVRENAQRVQLALGAGAIIGTWNWHLPTDQFTVDDAFARSFGLDPALGREGIPLAQIVATVHPNDQAGLAAAINEAVARGGAYAHQYRVRRADGNYYWLEANGRVDLGPDGKALSFPGVLIDVEDRRALARERDRALTELRELNDTLEQRVAERTEALRQSEEALRQSQKMEAVGQLTGGLAHDFNNLLAGISGSLEMMDTRISQGRLKDVEKYMVAAQGASKRAAALTHRLLAFSRRQTLAPKATNVNTLVTGMLDLIQRTVGPSVQIETVAVAGLWSALVDPSQLENALLNLCINARDAMPEGGRITIETGNRWIDRHGARQHDLSEGQYLSLCVSDTGTGMPPEVIAKAFDPFFTTKPLGQGTGLGLSMIYGFAKQSGGQVRIYSEMGEGTMVCIYLPRHRGDAEQAEVLPEAALRPIAEAGETVLIVDDEPTVRMLVTDVLGDLGYTAIEAADGAGGLRVLQSDVRIDLLITDVGLPGGMNGRQMADAARVGRPDLKVLFITGFAENALLNNGQLEPGMSVLTKPFAVDTMAARIRELIATEVQMHPTSAVLEPEGAD